MRKPPARNIQRMFAVTSYIGATLKAYDIENYELTRLQKQCNKAMNVYAIKTGSVHYNELSDKLGDIWGELGKKHNNVIEEDSVPALVEAIGMLVLPKDYKDFLGLSQYTTDVSNCGKDYSSIAESVLALNESINGLLGTKSVTLMKPKEKKKVKKVRTKSTKLNAHQKEVLEIQQRNERVTASLKDMIAKARLK